MRDAWPQSFPVCGVPSSLRPAHRALPEPRVFFGFLAREGLRAGEAVALRIRDVDWKRGAITPDENKTDDPRVWALNPAVRRAPKSGQINFPVPRTRAHSCSSTSTEPLPKSMGSPRSTSPHQKRGEA
jgi:integrase